MTPQTAQEMQEVHGYFGKGIAPKGRSKSGNKSKARRRELQVGQFIMAEVVRDETRHVLNGSDVRELGLSGDGRAPVESLLWNSTTRSTLGWVDGSFGLGWAQKLGHTFEEFKLAQPWRLADLVLTQIKRWCTWGRINRLGLKRDGWFDVGLFEKIKRIMLVQNWDGAANV